MVCAATLVDRLLTRVIFTFPPTHTSDRLPNQETQQECSRPCRWSGAVVVVARWPVQQLPGKQPRHKQMVTRDVKSGDILAEGMQETPQITTLLTVFCLQIHQTNCYRGDRDMHGAQASCAPAPPCRPTKFAVPKYVEPRNISCPWRALACPRWP